MTVLLVPFLFEYLPKIYHAIRFLRPMQNASGYVYGLLRPLTAQTRQGQGDGHHSLTVPNPPAPTAAPQTAVRAPAVDRRPCPNPQAAASHELGGRGFLVEQEDFFMWFMECQQQLEIVALACTNSKMGEENLDILAV
uniref:Uncharacterized protein n=1 Tax=Oryza brachyantha TaxID=4533 RepID=J3L9Z0_ORYBR